MIAIMFKLNDYFIKAIEGEDDLRFLMDLRNNPDTWIYLYNPHFVDWESQKRWYENMSKDPSRYYYIFGKYENSIKINLGMVRTDEINPLNRSIRVGGDIDPKYRGKGYSKEMYKLIFEYCFSYLNMHRVWLLVLGTNDRAINLYKKMGMSIEGVQREAIRREGRYQDHIMMSILEHEYIELFKPEKIYG